MITQKKFNQLSMEEKARYISEFGTYLMSKEYPELTTSLYSIHNFFAEIWIDHMAMVHIKSFSTDSCLKKYLNHIDLSDLSDLTS